MLINTSKIEPNLFFKCKHLDSQKHMKYVGQKMGVYNRQYQKIITHAFLNCCFTRAIWFESNLSIKQDAI